jgi:lysophospholipase L1-like esterase
MTRIALIMSLCVLTIVSMPLHAQGPTPAYAAIGDSIEFGLGDNIPADGIGYVPIFGLFLASAFQQPVEVHNFGTPFARVRDIRQEQLARAIAALAGNAPVVVSWGGGGNDLGEVATGPQFAACRQSESCLGRFSALLNEVEQTIDHTIRDLRQAIGPAGVILMRTQYNALLRPGCASSELAALGTATLEGAPGTVLEDGLNDRIRAIAQRHGAKVVDLFVPFAVNPGGFVAADCIHPSGAGYQTIAFLSRAAFFAAP